VDVVVVRLVVAVGVRGQAGSPALKARRRRLTESVVSFYDLFCPARTMSVYAQGLYLSLLVFALFLPKMVIIPVYMHVS
jgi:hypothetical protein